MRCLPFSRSAGDTERKKNNYLPYRWLERQAVFVKQFLFCTVGKNKKAASPSFFRPQGEKRPEEKMYLYYTSSPHSCQVSSFCFVKSVRCREIREFPVPLDKHGRMWYNKIVFLPSPFT